MASRTGVLSDEHILQHCAKYRPVPLGVAHTILQQPSATTLMNGKRLKHSQPPPRPENFDTMAKAVARIHQDPNVRDQMESEYAKEVMKAPRKVALASQLTTQRNVPVKETLSDTTSDTEGDMPNSDAEYTTETEEEVFIGSERGGGDMTRRDTLAGELQTPYMSEEDKEQERQIHSELQRRASFGYIAGTPEMDALLSRPSPSYVATPATSNPSYVPYRVPSSNRTPRDRAERAFRK